MKCRFLNNWFTRIFLICLLAVVWFGSSSCINPDPYETNPNFKLLVGDTTTYAGDSIHCSNPVVSSNNNTIYYLRVNSDNVGTYYDFAIGAVYLINRDGSNNQKILDGKFDALSISPDDKKLAIHLWRSYSEPDSFILIFNLNDSKIDSYPIPKRNVKDIEFAYDTLWVYYTSDVFDHNTGFSKTEFYRLNLSDSVSEFLQTIDWYIGFDMFENNSLYLDSVLTFPQINSLQDTIAAGNAGFFGENLFVRNIQKGTLSKLPIPYNNGLVGFPYWFPDGNTIVFAAEPYEEATGAPAEIWILENVLE